MVRTTVDDMKEATPWLPVCGLLFRVRRGVLFLGGCAVLVLGMSEASLLCPTRYLWSGL